MGDTITARREHLLASVMDHGSEIAEDANKSDPCSSIPPNPI
jgi:hypothetical protein